MYRWHKARRGCMCTGRQEQNSKLICRVKFERQNVRCFTWTVVTNTREPVARQQLQKRRKGR